MQEIKIKFVKRANQWCLSHQERLALGKIKYLQEWFNSRKEAEIRKKELIKEHENKKSQK